MIQKTGVFVIVLTVSLMAHDFDFTTSLDSLQQKVVDAVAQSYKPTFAPELSLEESVKKSTDKSTAPFRLYNYLCWSVIRGADSTKAVKSLHKRETLFFVEQPKIQTIILPQTTLAGDAKSPIVATFYMTSSCPSCKKSGIPLFQLAEGHMYGRFSVALKPIHNKFADIALLSADKQGKMWELFEAYGGEEKRLEKLGVLECAQRVGIDAQKLLDDIATQESAYVATLAANRKEGREHGLKYTPTLFFNGIRYSSNRHPIWIIDYIEWLEQRGNRK